MHTVYVRILRSLYCQFCDNLLESYNNCSSSSDSEYCKLGRRGIRKVYFITYSQLSKYIINLCKEYFDDAAIRAHHGKYDIKNMSKRIDYS